MDFEEEFKRSLLQECIFKEHGLETLQRSFIPPEVPHRESLVRKLMFNFKGVFKQDVGINIGIKGGGGFGKTLVSKYAMEKVQTVANDLALNLEYRYYTCFQYRTLGAILRDYMPENMYMSGKGFSISELIEFIVKSLRRDNKKLIFIIDEIQNLKPDEILQILSINEKDKEGGDEREMISTILVARDYDWNEILRKEPRIAQRINVFITLPKYDPQELYDIISYRRDLAFREFVMSDENVELIVDLIRDSGNVYYGIEVMRQAGLHAEEKGESEILPEMIRGAAKNVSSEFREPILQELKTHELLALYAVARILERLDKQNTSTTTMNEAFEEYKLCCEEYFEKPDSAHVITVFRKYIQKLNQNHLLKSRVKSLPTRGRRAEITIIDFSARLVRKKVWEILEMRRKTSQADS